MKLEAFLLFAFLSNRWKALSQNLDEPPPINLLNGQHLKVAVSPFPVAVQVKRNSSGYIVDVSGLSSEVISWLSARYQFTFSYLQVRDEALGPVNSSLPGLIHYLVRGDCQVIMAALNTAPSVFARMDYTHSFMDGPNSFMIPMPDPSNSVAAIIKPFQLWVWISMLVSIVGIFTAFLLLNYLIDTAAARLSAPLQTGQFEDHSGPRRGRLTSQRSKTAVISEAFESLKDAWAFVLGVLLNQGGYCSTRNEGIRLTAAAWCLATFVMINSYSCLLTSYLLAPSAQPLVEELNEIAQNPKYYVVIDKGQTIDIVLSTATVGVYKTLADKVRAFPNSRCVVTKDCTEIVKTGGSHVYINSVYAVMGAMYNDFRATGKCNLAMARRNGASSRSLHWGLTKKGYFTESFNRGILKMFERGLMNHWMHVYQPDVHKCVGEWNKLVQRKRNDDSSLPPLSLKNMTGAFAVLFFGCASSLIIFIGEIVCSHCKKRSLKV